MHRRLSIARRRCDALRVTFCARCRHALLCHDGPMGREQTDVKVLFSLLTLSSHPILGSSCPQCMTRCRQELLRLLGFLCSSLLSELSPWRVCRLWRLESVSLKISSRNWVGNTGNPDGTVHERVIMTPLLVGVS
jgi:hypothetical protein